MKKTTLLLAAALLAAGTVQAQDWKDALKKAAMLVSDQLTDGKLTEHALVGTWSYTGPGVKFEGEDMASELAGAAIESSVAKQLERAYALAGIKAGAGSFTFCDDGTFSALLGRHTLTGEYEFDASTHVITLKFAKGKLNLGSIPGHAYVSGQELVLVFPVTKLVELVSALGSRISSLASVTKMLDNYKNVYAGFAFGR